MKDEEDEVDALEGVWSSVATDMVVALVGRRQVLIGRLQIQPIRRHCIDVPRPRTDSAGSSCQ